MNIIKLNAIDSTNNFLKELSATQILDNFTTVVTENQRKGKGQRGAIWSSQDGKNLTFSTFINHNPAFTSELYTINIVVSLALIKVLEKYQLSQLHIKWPNDILSENKKICGILIENVIKSDRSIHCIIGIGLNVNQMAFENLPKASSMAILKNILFDKEVLLNEILASLKHHYNQLENPSLLWKKYHSYLYKKGTPVAFEDTSKKQFMGIIQGVSSFGKLMVLLEDDTIHEYDIKEIKMLY
ncbi:MAG: biotin--[acetyl-CoA-carboxylase] ligase [Flavobacterium sp.]|uniref:biotin--[acetyl-CoA-carboxylase] ligase n=1 Tax=Flavobacterium sp. TaxID=239 RepID=UPI000C61DE89|nr:biotin--[acetyl-CoA-carboxylase] ligase [Flavobacterium sp.]MBF04889.1 biotin--[acetyl-CoA-carboxylase] ligase [Flavobacterium sp.]|tara:strand:+ start:1040 stop:1765 length:726 start_codon:yes stop_codon:yes gene_type:complete